MKKKNNTWIKIVIVIIILELVVGGVIFAYKKLYKKDDGLLSVKDKQVVELYEKIAYYDIETLDVMSPKTMLYYGYKNLDINDSINCDVVKTKDDTTGYTCSGITDFISSEILEKSVKKIYGRDVIVEHLSFEIDKNHFVFYDEELKGYAIYTKDEEVSVDPVNLKLKKALKDDDNSIILTVDILDGVFGNVLETYNFTFNKSGKNYYLTSKEMVTK